jgi:hypothetical protein
MAPTELRSYERGDELAPIERLADLARLYDVALASLIPDFSAADRARLPQPPPILIDVQRLWTARDQRSRAAMRLIADIQGRRADRPGAIVSLRPADLRSLARIYDMSLGDLIQSWRERGVVIAH